MEVSAISTSVEAQLEHRDADDLEIRVRVAVQRLPLVRRLCMRYRYSGVPIEDLIQVGSIGLLKAIDKFDATRGTRFVAFAVSVILGEVRNYFRDHDWAVRVPRKLQNDRRAVEKAIELLTNQNGRTPRVQEICEVTALTQDEVHDTFELGKLGRPLSVEAEYTNGSNEDSSSILDFLRDGGAEIESTVDRIDLARGVETLAERERTILGLKFQTGLSQTGIASRLGISQMHVSRLQRGALSKLRAEMSD